LPNPAAWSVWGQNETRAGDDRRGLISNERLSNHHPNTRDELMFEPHNFTPQPSDAQAPFSALRQDLPYISFDPLGDVATIAVVEEGDSFNRSLKERERRKAEPRAFFTPSPVNAALAATLALLRTSKEIVRLGEDQAMRRVTPTLWLRKTSCEQDEKGGSMDHLPPY